MITAAKVGANRKNSLKSTGPKSPEGKATSGKNALRHGLLSREVVPPGEYEKAFCQELWIRSRISARYVSQSRLAP